MKKFLSLLILAATAFIPVAADSNSGGAAIEFTSTTFDMGTIHADGGKTTATYTFVNSGTAPLIITRVTNGGCGCTDPRYPKHPIAPGDSGKVVITFNPAGRRGEFNRKVDVKTNAKGKQPSLRFSGVIIP